MTYAPRILIVRLSAIGDVVQSMPIACALREHFPKAFVAWAVGGGGAKLLEGHPAIDELITLPRRWLKSPRTVWQLRRRLRTLKFDVAIDGQGLSKSAILALLSGAPRRIGFGGEWGRELSPWLNNELAEITATHVVDRNLQLLRPLGIESPTVRFDVPEHARDAEAAGQTIRDLGLTQGFALFNAGAGWPSKLWPNDRFAAVARHLGDKRDLPTLVVWGSADERTLAEEVVAGSQGHTQVAPDTSLTELAALARRARLMVASDTGPLHLAAAVGTPCVGLYGPWPADKHGPYGPQHIALQELIFKGPTRARRSASPEYMEAIRVEHVCAACDEILARDSRQVA